MLSFSTPHPACLTFHFVFTTPFIHSSWPRLLRNPPRTDCGGAGPDFGQPRAAAGPRRAARAEERAGADQVPRHAGGEPLVGSLTWPCYTATQVLARPQLADRPVLHGSVRSRRAHSHPCIPASSSILLQVCAVSLVGQWIAEAQAKLNGSLRMHMCEWRRAELRRAALLLASCCLCCCWCCCNGESLICHCT